MQGGLKRTCHPPSPEPGTEAGSTPEEPHPPERAPRAAHAPGPREPKLTETPRDRDPREPRPVLLRGWGKGCTKVRPQSFGGDTASGRAEPLSRLVPPPLPQPSLLQAGTALPRLFLL